MNRADLASERAAQWIIAQEDGDWAEDDQTAFDAWLAEADGHKAAYWRLKHSWREADRMSALGRGFAESSHQVSNSRRSWWLPPAIAASIVAMIGTGYLAMQPTPEAKTVVVAEYETPVGARRTIGLPDGSRVQLNTASFVRAAVTPQRREVWVDKGEAFFEVAHREGQSFVVHAGNRQIIVLGTKFSVRHDNDKVMVTVLEGRVRLDELAGSRTIRSSVIVGGDIALAQGPTTLVTTRSEERVEGALAWRTGMLSFDQTSLSDVAAEFNRYNEKQLVVADAEAGGIRIGGMFPTSNPAAFVRLLRDAYGLKVEESATMVKISS